MKAPGGSRLQEAPEKALHHRGMPPRGNLMLEAFSRKLVRGSLLEEASLRKPSRGGLIEQNGQGIINGVNRHKMKGKMGRIRKERTGREIKEHKDKG